MLAITEIQEIMLRFGLTVESVTGFYDTSHNDDDKRLNYVLDNKYVMKMNSAEVMCEKRLKEIQRLISRYRSIGVYCPDLLATTEGALSCVWKKDGKEYTANAPTTGDPSKFIEHVLSAEKTHCVSLNSLSSGANNSVNVSDSQMETACQLPIKN